MNREWLKDLKVGDRFVTGDYPEISIHEVVRFTDTLIVTKYPNSENTIESRFKKENGKMLGCSEWHQHYAEQIDDQVRGELLRQRVNYMLKKTSVKSMSIGQLERIKDALLNR